MTRNQLNWFPTIEVGTEANVKAMYAYDPWDLFPGQVVLNRADLPVLSRRIQTTENDLLQRELLVMEAIIKAGGYVRKQSGDRKL